MSNAQMQCPTCGARISIGTLMCPSCGVNIRTGETYDTRLKRAKPKDIHPERLHQGVYVAVALVFALVMLGGFLYQRRVEQVFELKAELYAGYVGELDEIDALVHRGLTRDAIEKGLALITKMQGREREIIIEVAPTSRSRQDSRVSKAVRRAEKTFLNNLIKKVKHKLPQLSEAGPGTAG